MLDVADDGHDEVFESCLVAPDRQHVQQALRRMVQVRFTGIQHRHVRRHVLADEVGDSRLRVAHDENVHLHGLQRVDRIDQALALGA